MVQKLLTLLCNFSKSVIPVCNCFSSQFSHHTQLQPSCKCQQSDIISGERIQLKMSWLKNNVMEKVSRLFERYYIVVMVINSYNFVRMTSCESAQHSTSFPRKFFTLKISLSSLHLKVTLHRKVHL